MATVETDRRVTVSERVAGQLYVALVAVATTLATRGLLTGIVRFTAGRQPAGRSGAVGVAGWIVAGATGVVAARSLDRRLSRDLGSLPARGQRPKPAVRS